MQKYVLDSPFHKDPETIEIEKVYEFYKKETFSGLKVVQKILQEMINGKDEKIDTVVISGSSITRHLVIMCNLCNVWVYVNSELEDTRNTCAVGFKLGETRECKKEWFTTEYLDPRIKPMHRNIHRNKIK
jgi:hypothetical protein